MAGEGRDESGKFAHGNRLWEARSSHGRKPIFASPDDLWDACCQYFQWVDDNPLLESKLFSFQGAAHEGIAPKMRAMTISGMCLYLDISEDCWAAYRSRPDFIGVTTRAEKVIFNQKFAGAAADLLNANIIARDLGLRDGQDVKHSGSIDLNSMTDEELANRIANLTAQQATED